MAISEADVILDHLDGPPGERVAAVIEMRVVDVWPATPTHRPASIAVPVRVWGVLPSVPIDVRGGDAKVPEPHRVNETSCGGPGAADPLGAVSYRSSWEREGRPPTGPTPLDRDLTADEIAMLHAAFGPAHVVDLVDYPPVHPSAPGWQVTVRDFEAETRSVRAVIITGALGLLTVGAAVFGIRAAHTRRR
jgi:hypothetical protein